MFHLDWQLTSSQLTSPKEANGVREFFEKLAASKARALLLDYDGTLARFCPDAMQAAPYTAVPALLERIRDYGRTRLVVITGRRAYDARELLGLEQIEVWGSHGLERLRPDGSFEMPELSARTIQALFKADELFAEEGLTRLAEHKPAGIAIHWRGLVDSSAEIERKIQSVWARLPDPHGLRLSRFDGGMEIRATLRNKGDAVRAILAELGPEAAVAYLGDDETDEDAFSALKGSGLGVLVRREFRPTVADVWIRPPEAVISFLADWITACGGAS